MAPSCCTLLWLPRGVLLRNLSLPSKCSLRAQRSCCLANVFFATANANGTTEIMLFKADLVKHRMAVLTSSEMNGRQKSIFSAEIGSRFLGNNSLRRFDVET
ncbi:hypothetical protein Y032_0293g1625 [Ancylostoma ceylanicum]|uniref:Secreted protein n=1 Tax=Ancylostoma ceylanicum TaxID=53326 RepID=A0A016S646_9BILA|nr:hypothetical protein Y032_0293g1625 [Ancylostoma ceylanicum]